MPLITSIQKYSIHDGDGIRTTVFFKGCPLSCVWCHNPETQSYQQQLSYDRERCVGCRACMNACSAHAIKADGDKMKTNEELCRLCGDCVEECIFNLREIVGKEYTVKELIKELKKDEMFYEESGGGVTLSGGEVMAMDMDYVETLVKELHKQGISVTIDTCGQAAYDKFQRILPYVTTFLYDIKAIDPQLHKQYVGVDNKLILENLKKLSEDGARIYIRIPTIKEVNGTKEGMEAVISFLLENRIHVAQVNLLPYHNIGAGKYEKIDTVYEGTSFTAPNKDEMEHFKQLFINAGFHNAKIGG
ncbi:MAG: glycyl-radical enzyme activating protein [Lachnospiraceae bacterium]